MEQGQKGHRVGNLTDVQGKAKAEFLGYEPTRGGSCHLLYGCKLYHFSSGASFFLKMEVRNLSLL